MTNKEYLGVLLKLDLDCYSNRKLLFDFIYSRTIPCVFACGRCFSGFLTSKIIAPEQFRKCSDIWLNSEVKEDGIKESN